MIHVDETIIAAREREREAGKYVEKRNVDNLGMYMYLKLWEYDMLNYFSLIHVKELITTFLVQMKVNQRHLFGFGISFQKSCWT